MTSFSWPLSINTFGLVDRAKIAWWLLTNDRFTMGERVAELEDLMSDYAGAKALMTSSGSTANHLVFELWKVKNPGENAVVIAPAVTWISSVTPAVMAGFKVEFCDIDRVDLSFDYTMLERLLKKHKRKRVIIWGTALIGYCPDMSLLHQMAAQHGKAEVYLDSCENTFSRTRGSSILASASITTTSTYFAHQLVTCEGGFVFFKDRHDYDLARMFRNHGMVRSLSPDHPLRREIEAAHQDIDPAFLFALRGTNYRPSDMHAVFGLLDYHRMEESREHRVEMFEVYRELLDADKYYLPPYQSSHVAFCLPIFVRDRDKLAEVKQKLTAMGVETRPLISGNLLRQPAFKGFGNPTSFPNAEWVHWHGMYIGMHAKVTHTKMRELTTVLNSI